ncbi:MoeA domain-containing protein [Campylobacter sputorum subsp. bubulus]|uniref:Molybdopterin molybdenumtransferase n=1 Tax=Campylobacter sputorum subsp. sputorum TaxID=32024 RepID=A0A381DHV0_9BACT|nr:molybdopterin molybdotransferase MoeA [Campylobacter sputorum]ASM35315.1 molybdopterin molybdenumtransferase [Campylobacter sputorum aubsp. sputorum RM3237]KAB0582941.1 molybdopterin molybdotransferase MoeA [Campylobacter sputorum subsp. sputorum]QEL05506.1 molybdopterin molybdenumtransferase [Campylobacter sputorum subsp. sputorum]SUX08675.1 MoeA domain-containing protein [Campylobacter sputorum subsp. bubulus]SUX10269.1 MoeA domain-containing protein [Campylobacter sputorum subsp. sputoru
MNYNDGLNLLFSKINTCTKNEYTNIASSLGKVLAKDIYASKDLPCFDNSALDGYAFKFDDKDNPLNISQITIFAGDKTQYHAAKNEAIRIMTGAIMPKNTDTIVRLEDAIIKDNKLFIDEKTKKNNAFRYKGEEIKSGEILLKKGTKITPSEIMLLASQGINEILVFSKPSIALFSSGDELVEVWENASSEQIYNVNASAIASLLNYNGFKSVYKGIIKDSLEDTKKAFLSNLNYDVLICSGGASKGDKDFMKEALLGLGYKEIFDRLNLKPGGPVKVFIKDDKFVFILPGNPMAAFFTCFLILIPALKKMNAQADFKHKTINTKISNTIKLKPQRTNIILGNYNDGVFTPYLENYGSGMIKPLTLNNAICLSNEQNLKLESGDEIQIIKYTL